MDWHCDGVRLFDGRLQLAIAGAWQICLFVSQVVSAPTDASAPASASWFDLIVVSFPWFLSSAPAGASPVNVRYPGGASCIDWLELEASQGGTAPEAC